MARDRIGVDIGGTFTDFALHKGDEVVLEKTLSTPEDRSLAVMTGLERLADRKGRDLGEFLERVDAWLTEHELPADSDEESVRLGVGTYWIEQAINERRF